MREMNLREARARLGELAEAAHHGETITLTKHGRPYALLTPLENAMTAQQDDNDWIPQLSAKTPATAKEWAAALDAEMKRTGWDAGTLLSVAYSNGEVLGVVLEPDDPRADDEHAVLVSEQGWVVRYIRQAGYWQAD